MPKKTTGIVRQFLSAIGIPTSEGQLSNSSPFITKEEAEALLNSGTLHQCADLLAKAAGYIQGKQRDFFYTDYDNEMAAKRGSPPKPPGRNSPKYQAQVSAYERFEHMLEGIARLAVGEREGITQSEEGILIPSDNSFGLRVTFDQLDKVKLRKAVAEFSAAFGDEIRIGDEVKQLTTGGLPSTDQAKQMDRDAHLREACARSLSPLGLVLERADKLKAAPRSLPKDHISRTPEAFASGETSSRPQLGPRK